MLFGQAYPEAYQVYALRLDLFGRDEYSGSDVIKVIKIIRYGSDHNFYIAKTSKGLMQQKKQTELIEALRSRGN